MLSASTSATKVDNHGRPAMEEDSTMRESENRNPAKPEPSQTPRWILLPVLVLAALAIYYPVARHNLPVAMNVDDRTSLGVLLRFHQGSANPKFFMYPTLFYYLTYAFTAVFGFSRILLTGHLFNLALLGLTAWLSALFCVRQFKSVGAGLVAAYCVLLSPTLVSSAAYLCTDILLSAMTILSLDLLMLYFRSRTTRNWLYAMLAVGCAIAAKYTAAVLFIVYAVGEVVYIYNSRIRGDTEQDPAGALSFSRPAMYFALLTASAMCALLAFFFPTQSILHFVALHRTNLNTRSTQEYLVFLNKLRRLAVELSLGAAAMLAACWWSKTFYKAISLKRLYYGMLLIAGVFLVTTPYSLLDPSKFIYDLGALLRANVVVVGNHQQWSEYWHWLFDVENRVLVVLGIFGLGLMVFRLSWVAFTPIAFAVIHIVAICTAHRGFSRYLDPLLPLLFCGAALLIRQAWQAAKIAHSKNGVLLYRTALCLAAAVLVGQTVRKAIQGNREASGHTAYYTAYDQVLKDAPRIRGSDAVSAGNYGRGRVLYAGFAPSIELDLAGFQTHELSWTSLAQDAIGKQLSCDELLILNERAATANHLNASLDSTVDVLLDDPRGEGQMVLRRRGCNKATDKGVSAHL